MKIIEIAIFIFCMPISAQADVFKCENGLKVIYQSDPCKKSLSSSKVEIIKRSQEREAEIAGKYKEWYQDFKSRELTEYKVKEFEFEKNLRIKEVEALQIEADAQYKQQKLLDSRIKEIENTFPSRAYLKW
ncbi:MAG: hypothetical protein ACXVA2_22160 [Mucilaginibacter sp.]